MRRFRAGRKLLVGFWTAMAVMSQAVVPVAALTVNELLSRYLPFSAASGSCAAEVGGVPQITGIFCILAKSVDILLRFAGGVALLFLVYGGVQYIISGGDKIALTTAKSTITHAVLGLILILGASLIINIALGVLYP